MNLKEHILDEIELHSSLLDEGISCLLHTILFVRAPGSIKHPEDAYCRHLAPLVYAKCGDTSIDSNVIHALADLKRSLVEVGPNLRRGNINLSFYVEKENKGIFGFGSEKVKAVFERWRVPVLVNEIRTDNASELERTHILDSSREAVASRMMKIIVDVNIYCDHIPADVYHYEIDGTNGGNEDSEQSMVTRFMSPVSLASLSQKL